MAVDKKILFCCRLPTTDKFLFDHRKLKLFCLWSDPQLSLIPLASEGIFYSRPGMKKKVFLKKGPLGAEGDKETFWLLSLKKLKWRQKAERKNQSGFFLSLSLSLFFFLSLHYKERKD